MRIQALTGGSTTGAKAASTLYEKAMERQLAGLLQVEIVGTSATVDIEARLSDDFSYVVVATVSSNTIQAIPIFPDMRVNITAITAAVVTVGLGIPIG